MRQHVRISRHHPVDITTAGSATPIRCRALNLSTGGLLVAGSSQLQGGDSLRVTLNLDDGEHLALNARVLRISGDKAALVFGDNPASARQRLQQLLSPRWDHETLLEGVVNISPWIEGNDLASWMRLTSLVSQRGIAARTPAAG